MEDLGRCVVPGCQNKRALRYEVDEELNEKYYRLCREHLRKYEEEMDVKLYSTYIKDDNCHQTRNLSFSSHRLI